MIKYIALLIISCFLIQSCKYLDFRQDHEIVAQIGDNILYKKDISNLIPEGTSAADSIEMLKQYINNWAIKYLMLNRADRELSKQEKDVEKELEEYKNSLLAFRYQKKYVESRLDTLITQEEKIEYYNNNSHNIKLNNSIAICRIIKVTNSSPNLQIIRSLYKSNSEEDKFRIEEICHSSAEKYIDFNNEWVDFAVIARELPLSVLDLEKELESKNWLEINDSGYYYFIYLYQKRASGETPPFEYYKSRIRETVLSKRKQNLLRELEKNLIDEALAKNLIKTNLNDKP